MSVSAAQAAAFYDEALQMDEVWTVRDDGGVPAPLGASGRRAMPFWSKASRVERIIEQVPAYAAFRLDRIPLDKWRTEWLPDLDRNELMVGLNRSGSRATGYDLSPSDVEQNLKAREQNQQGSVAKTDPGG